MGLPVKDSSRGSVLVEATLALPFLILTFFCLYQFSLILYRYPVVQQFAYISALIAADNPSSVAESKIKAVRDSYFAAYPNLQQLNDALGQEGVEAPPREQSELPFGTLALLGRTPEFLSGPKLVRATSRSLVNNQAAPNPLEFIDDPIITQSYTAAALINLGAPVQVNLNQFETSPGKIGFSPPVAEYGCNGQQAGSANPFGMISGQESGAGGVAVLQSCAAQSISIPDGAIPIY